MNMTLQQAMQVAADLEERGCSDEPAKAAQVLRNHIHKLQNGCVMGVVNKGKDGNASVVYTQEGFHLPDGTPLFAGMASPQVTDEQIDHMLEEACDMTSPNAVRFVRKFFSAPPAAETKGICQHCNSRYPLHDLECPVAVEAISKAASQEAKPVAADSDDWQAEHKAALNYIGMPDRVIDSLVVHGMSRTDFARAVEFEVLARCSAAAPQEQAPAKD